MPLQIRGQDDGLDGTQPYSVWVRSFSSNPVFNNLIGGIDLQNAALTDTNPCVADVVAAFDSLPLSGQRLAVGDYNFPAGEYFFDGIPWNNHFQAVARTRTGPYLMITGKGEDASDLFTAVFPSKQEISGRWGFNLNGPIDAYVVAPHEVIDRTYDHAGGLGMFGDFAAIPLEAANNSKVVFYDLSTPTAPRKLAYEVERPGNAHAGGAAVVRLRGDGRYLLAVQSQENPEGIQFYISNGTDARVNPVFLMIPGNSAPVPWVGHYQNINFIEECPSVGNPEGRLFMIATFHTDVVFGGIDIADLFEVSFPGGYEALPTLDQVSFRSNFQCKVNGSDWCSFGAGAGAYVTPAGELILYSTYFWRNIDGDGVLKLMEF